MRMLMKILAAMVKALTSELSREERRGQTTNDESQQFKDWTTTRLNKEAVDVWREACAQVRRLSDDVWNGLKFFLTINSILIGAGAAVAKLQSIDWGARWILVLLAILGFSITCIAKKVMKKQRTYYSEMLLKKALIEEELGFYATKLSNIDLSFVWGIKPEDLKHAKKSPEKWVQKHAAAPKTITRYWFWIYDFLLVLYAVAFLVLACNCWCRLLHLHL